MNAYQGEKDRVSRHNGRSGKNGVYNPKHNDRSFDIANAENIDAARTQLNLYWDCKNGLRTHEENKSGAYPSFHQLETECYTELFANYLECQKVRNKKAGHCNRDKTVEDLMNDKRICPEETVYQIGREGDCPPPEKLLAIVSSFMDWFRESFGSNILVMDWALHLDETSPHIHARQVFFAENRYGEIQPMQEKALEKLGIAMPEPEKKQSKTNNRKVSFDAICRDKLLEICQEHGLAVETEAIYGGKVYLEKQDYIIESQRKKIGDLEETAERLSAENAVLTDELQFRREAYAATVQATADTEKEMQAAQKKLDRLLSKTKDAEAFAAKLGTADELLPRPPLLVSAQTYWENTALPLARKLVNTIRGLYQKLTEAHKENEKLRQEVHVWQSRAEDASDNIKKAGLFDRLCKAMGVDAVNRILKESGQQQQKIHPNRLDRAER